MRKLSLALLAAASFVGPSSVSAADLDYDFLRGPEYDAPVAVAAIDWSGVYLGGHGGWTSSSHKFPDNFSSIASAAEIRNPGAAFDFTNVSALETFGRRRSGGSFGGYAGYNLQFDDVVVGAEVDYTNFGLTAASIDVINPYPNSTNGTNTFGLSGTKIQDYGTVRGRAGYTFGSLMPYVTGGVAIGRARIFDNLISQSYSYSSETGAITFGRSVPYGTAKTKVVSGITLGGGLEYAITPSILLRAEYQYVLFNDFDGHKANINTVRGGAAVKF